MTCSQGCMQCVSVSSPFQGILFCKSECIKTPQDLVKIYLHESNRVYRDRMVEDKDFATFDKLQSEIVGKFYEVRGFSFPLTKRVVVIRACVAGLARLFWMVSQYGLRQIKLIRAKTCQPALPSVQQIRGNTEDKKEMM